MRNYILMEGHSSALQVGMTEDKAILIPLQAPDVICPGAFVSQNGTPVGMAARRWVEDHEAYLARILQGTKEEVDLLTTLRLRAKRLGPGLHKVFHSWERGFAPRLQEACALFGLPSWVSQLHTGAFSGPRIGIVPVLDLEFLLHETVRRDMGIRPQDRDLVPISPILGAWDEKAEFTAARLGLSDRSRLAFELCGATFQLKEVKKPKKVEAKKVEAKKVEAKKELPRLRVVGGEVKNTALAQELIEKGLVEPPPPPPPSPEEVERQRKKEEWKLRRELTAHYREAGAREEDVKVLVEKTIKTGMMQPFIVVPPVDFTEEQVKEVQQRVDAGQAYQEAVADIRKRSEAKKAVEEAQTRLQAAKEEVSAKVEEEAAKKAAEEQLKARLQEVLTRLQQLPDSDKLQKELRERVKKGESPEDVLLDIRTRPGMEGQPKPSMKGAESKALSKANKKALAKKAKAG